MTLNQYCRILCIGLSEPEAKVMVALLQSTQSITYEWLYAESLERAWAEINRGGIGLILYYIDLRQDEALEHFSHLCQDVAHLPIVVIGDVEDEHIETKLDGIGAQDYLALPYLSSSGFASRLRLAIDRHALLMELEEERQSTTEMIEAIRSGKVESISGAKSPSGRLRLLDAQLVEKNEQLVHKIEAKNRQLEELAHYDPLTQLPNRRQFERVCRREIMRARRHQHLLALLFIDLDKFKTINDTYGHFVGDLLLQEVARRLQATIRESDFVARIAGDEFAVLLTDLKRTYEAGIVAKKLIQAVNQVCFLGGREVHASFSIGIACFPRAGDTLETLSKHADIAMYRAKESGRNNYQFFSTAMEGEYTRRLAVENAIAFAVERNELFLAYQPQVDSHSSEILVLEALLRWKHPDLGLLSPTEFIPIAEEVGQIMAIGRWVFDHACEQFAKWYRQGHQNLRLAINLSPLQFLQADLASQIMACLTEHQLPANAIELEITETAVMHYTRETERLMESLHQEGVRFSIDDFGTGYSSLSHLRKMALNGLKIDKSFVMDIGQHEDAARIVASVLALGKSLGLEVIAEGVETAEQKAFLQLHHCDRLQGYYFSRPVAAEEIPRLLSESSKL